jgi:hypothetical protein
MKRLKLYLYATACVALLTAAGAGVFIYATRDNSAPTLMATDDTVMHTVAVNSPDPEATREHPVRIEAQIERQYGLHIGTPMKVRFVVRTLNSTKIRFDTLMRGVLTRSTNTWRMVGKPTIISEVKKDGFTTRVIDLTVAVWEPPVMPDPAPQAVDGANATAAAQAAEAAAKEGPPQPELWPFVAEFLYSTGTIGEGDQKTDRWDYIKTPPIRFGFASLLEPGAGATDTRSSADPYRPLDIGPLGDVPQYQNRVGLGLIALGSVVSFASFVYLLALFVGWLRRRRMPAALPAEVSQYRAAIAEAMHVRSKPSFLEQKRVAVRDYLGGASRTDQDLSEAWREHPLHERVVELLALLSGAVRYGRLSGYEETRVDEHMKLLIDSKLSEGVRVGWFKRLRTAVAGAAGRGWSRLPKIRFKRD